MEPPKFSTIRLIKESGNVAPMNLRVTVEESTAPSVSQGHCGLKDEDCLCTQRSCDMLGFGEHICIARPANQWQARNVPEVHLCAAQSHGTPMIGPLDRFNISILQGNHASGVSRLVPQILR